MPWQTNADQVNGLTPLIPLFNPRATDMHPIIHRVIQILRNELICDFLLNDSQAYLHALTSSSNTARAISCTGDLHHIKSPVFSLNKTSRLTSFSALIPAFELSSLSLGVVVAEEHTSRYKDVECRERDTSVDIETMHVQGRFLLDGSDHSYALFFSDDSCVRVVLYDLKASARATRFQIVFDRLRLLDVLNGRDDSSGLHVLSCVRMCSALDLFRLCERCRGGCECVRKDWEGRKVDLVSTLSRYVGVYCGISHMLHFAHGAHLRSSAYGSVRQNEIVGNSGRTVALIRSAVRVYLKDVHCNPWAAVLGCAVDDGVLSAIREGEIGVGGGIDPELHAELRSYVRRQKNRECARRSNDRKRMENIERKKELKRLKELERGLVARERSLRLENVALRKMLEDGHVGRLVGEN